MLASGSSIAANLHIVRVIAPAHHIDDDGVMDRFYPPLNHATRPSDAARMTPPPDLRGGPPRMPGQRAEEADISRPYGCQEAVTRADTVFERKPDRTIASAIGWRLAGAAGPRRRTRVGGRPDSGREAGLLSAERRNAVEALLSCRSACQRNEREFTKIDGANEHGSGSTRFSGRLPTQ